MENKASYSFTWANQKAKELAEKYGRATELILWLYGITMRQFAAFLAFNDPAWVFLRNRIHFWDNNLPYRTEKYLTDVTLLEVEMNSVNRFYDPKRLKDRLTGSHPDLMLEEQGKKGLDCRPETGNPRDGSPASTTPRWIQGELFSDREIGENLCRNFPRR